MEEKPASPQIRARMKHVGQSANKLLMIEYFMRQYPTLAEGLSKLVEEYEGGTRLAGVIQEVRWIGSLSKNRPDRLFR